MDEVLQYRGEDCIGIREADKVPRAVHKPGDFASDCPKHVASVSEGHSDK